MGEDQMQKLLFLLTAFLIGRPEFAFSEQVFYLNQYGKKRFYSISAFNTAGLPIDELVASPHDIGARHLAWPSAIRVNGKVLLYSSIYREGWHEVGLWTSDNNVKFIFERTVFSSEDVPEADEHGIGPVHVGYFPDKSFPFVMYYLIRGKSGPGQKIGVAKSKNGIEWKIEGDAFYIEEDFEAYGVSASYVCGIQDTYYLFYLAFDTPDYSTASSGLAISKGSVFGPFKKHSEIFRYGGYRGSIISGEAFKSSIVVDDATKGLKIQNPYVISDDKGNKIQVVVPIRKNGNIIFLDRPLLYNSAKFRIASLFSNKVDPSFVYEKDGVWYGLFTAFGSFDGITTEYVAPMKSPSPHGPWLYDYASERQVPYFRGNNSLLNLYSLENPVVLASDSRCSNTGL